MRCVRVHATIMSFLLCSVHHSDGLHFCIAIASATLLGVGRRGGFSSLLFPDVTVTVGFFPSRCFRRRPPFVDLFSNFYVIGYGTSFPVGLKLKILSLKVGLFTPCIQNCMQENLVEIFHFHFLGVVRSLEERKEAVFFCQPCRKTLEGHASRFTHCAPNHTLFLGERIYWE